jgi:hypothetical protein
VLTNEQNYDIIKLQKRKEMIKMFELICTIPENVGWVIVGAVGMLTAVVAFEVGKILVQMWKDYHEEESEEEVAVV